MIPSKEILISPPQWIDPVKNHWKLKSLPPNLCTHQKVTDQISRFLDMLQSVNSPYNPTVYWESPQGKLQKAFVSKIGIYSPESRKTMPNPTQFEGGFKTGRNIINTHKIGFSLLLFKNKKDKETSYAAVQRDIKVAQELENKIPNIQKPLDTLHWVTRKGTRKIGYICLKQESDLLELVKRQAQNSTSLHIHLSQQRDLQQEMIQILKQISDEGFLYRDVKLENFLVTLYGKLILADFDMCSKELIEPNSFQGTPASMAPEYLYLILLKNKLQYNPSKEIVNLIVNEKITVFSLGIEFLRMNFYAAKISHLHPLTMLPRPGATYADRVCTLKSQWVPYSFRNFLKQKDPTIPIDYPSYQNPIPKHIDPIPSGNSLIFLIESMLAEDPRNRPSLAQVALEIKRLRKKED